MKNDMSEEYEIIKRKEYKGVNVEFAVQSVAYGLGAKISLIKPKIKSLGDIIRDIDNGIKYYTINSTNTKRIPVIVKGGNKVSKYLSSIPDDESDNNIDNLPIYE